MELVMYPLVESTILNKQAAAWEDERVVLTSDEALQTLKREFDSHGPYAVAKWNDVLVDNSGEEFAIQFMSLYNSVSPGTY